MSARRVLDAIIITGVGVVFWGAALASLELAAVGAAIAGVAAILDDIIRK